MQLNRLAKVKLQQCPRSAGSVSWCRWLPSTPMYTLYLYTCTNKSLCEYSTKFRMPPQICSLQVQVHVHTNTYLYNAGSRIMELYRAGVLVSFWRLLFACVVCYHGIARAASQAHLAACCCFLLPGGKCHQTLLSSERSLVQLCSLIVPGTSHIKITSACYTGQTSHQLVRPVT